MVYIVVWNSFLRLFLLEVSLIHPWTCSMTILIDTTVKLTVLSAGCSQLVHLEAASFASALLLIFSASTNKFASFCPSFLTRSWMNVPSHFGWLFWVKNNPLPLPNTSKDLTLLNTLNIEKSFMYKKFLNAPQDKQHLHKHLQHFLI